MNGRYGQWVWNGLFNKMARVGLFGWKPRTLSWNDPLWEAQFADGRLLYFVSQRRFRLYSRGYDFRLQRVATRYGAEELFQIRDGDTVVEVGANVGEFTLYAATRGARVLAVEPDRLNLDAIRRNTAAHRGHVEIAPVACAEAEGEAVFYAYPEGADSSLVRPAKYSDSYRVPTRRLDDIVRERGLETIDVLKCDAEGAEAEVLRGASGILDRVRCVTVDVSPEREGKSTDRVCREILEQAGFSLQRFHKGRILFGARK